MKRRYALWLFVGLVLVGLWPSAAAPITLAAAGAAVILAAVPPSVLLLAAVVVWLKRKPAPAKSATA